MATPKDRFNRSVGVLILLLLLLLVLSMESASRIAAGSADDMEMPISIRATMITFIDHAAHRLWDYGAVDGVLADEEWRIVEFYAVQLAAAGPMIALGGSGEMDESWAASPRWTDHAREMTDAALGAMSAARAQDPEKLRAANDALADSCSGCHTSFRPELADEGRAHEPDFDFLHYQQHQ